MAYPIRKNKLDWRSLEPMTNHTEPEDYISEHYDFWLSDEFIPDRNGKVYRYYRLHAKYPHNIEMALAYDVKCPRCKNHVMKQVGRCQDYYKLGLYECPVCDRKK